MTGEKPKFENGHFSHSNVSPKAWNGYNIEKYNWKSQFGPEKATKFSETAISGVIYPDFLVFWQISKTQDFRLYSRNGYPFSAQNL